MLLILRVCGIARIHVLQISTFECTISSFSLDQGNLAVPHKLVILLSNSPGFDFLIRLWELFHSLHEIISDINYVSCSFCSRHKF